MTSVVDASLVELLERYARDIAPTDRLPDHELRPVLMGLIGEVGSVIATSKKKLRDEDAFSEYDEAIREEYGDTLWYLAAACRRLSVDLPEMFKRADDTRNAGATPDTVHGGHESAAWEAQLQRTLMTLGRSIAEVLAISEDTSGAAEKIVAFTRSYLAAVGAVGVDFPAVVSGNLDKARGRFMPPDLSKMPTFDAAFEPEEQLPWEFEIEVTQRKSGQSYLRWNGVFIGDPLTDNITDKDGYRFHDVFHFAHAAVLHWSPVMRALIKQKRKSCKAVDEAQDGGRAIVVEEGLSAYVFSRAKKLNLFAGHPRVSFDLLKTVQQFVRGYEVDVVPLSLWESAILQGYEVFRELSSQQGGTIVGSRTNRTIKYRPPTRR